MSLRIGILGIAGRMGRLLAEEVVAVGAALAGGTLRSGTPPDGAAVFNDAEALLSASDVAIDFTRAASAAGHAAAAARANTPFVLGTSGLSPEAEAAVARAAERVPV